MRRALETVGRCCLFIPKALLLPCFVIYTSVASHGSKVQDDGATESEPTDSSLLQEDARRNVMREARTVDRLSFVTRGSQTLQTLIRYEESRGSGADENAAAAANDDSK